MKFETIKKAIELEGKKIRRTAGRAHYAHLWLRFEPAELNSGVQASHSVTEARLRPKFVAAAEQGIRRALSREGQEGFPITDIRFSIFDGSFVEIDSSEMDYDEVGFQTTIEAIRKVGTTTIDGSAS